MHILVSAYACEPNKGSEPAVGWHWALELAKLGHTVWVITRSNNQAAIEAAPSIPSNLNFIYYDLPLWLRRWKQGRQGVHLYYLLWQFGAFLKAKKMLPLIQPDWVHHVTFVSVRQPSFMHLLGIPFIFGPVSGGDCIPEKLKKSIPLKGKFLEWVRERINQLVRWDPLLCWCFLRAEHIAVTSAATQLLLPSFARKKSVVHLAIGAPERPKSFNPNQKVPTPEKKPLSYLYVGNLLYLKGPHLLLRAFASLINQVNEAQLTVIGTGPDESWLKTMAEKLMISEKISWIPRLPRKELLQAYSQYDVLVFPSLRDSGGMVVLEAMTVGVPSIVLNLAGPGFIVTPECGISIDAQDVNEDEIVQALASAMKTLGENPELRQRMSKGAIARAEALSWQNQVKSLYQRLALC